MCEMERWTGRERERERERERKKRRKGDRPRKEIDFTHASMKQLSQKKATALTMNCHLYIMTCFIMYEQSNFHTSNGFTTHSFYPTKSTDYVFIITSDVLI